MVVSIIELLFVYITLYVEHIAIFIQVDINNSIAFYFELISYEKSQWLNRSLIFLSIIILVIFNILHDRLYILNHDDIFPL